jgi:peptidoglycan biosynthesis protein MviN/MurJ (putative lipid II flippase)
VNLIANACLIPSMKSMGAVIGTLAAEMTVPVVQYLILRRELPYGRYLRHTAMYAVIGGIMLLGVRGVGRLLPQETWLNLGIQTAAGIAIYGGLCLGYWKAAGRGIFWRD